MMVEPRPFITEAQIQCQVILYGIYGGYSGTRMGVFTEYFDFPRRHSTTVLYHHLLGMC
jgi:hypothetical protein